MPDLLTLHEDWVAPLLRDFRKSRVLVVGDLILDRFVWGKVERISPEAPVPVVVIERETSHLGGAANVALNLSRLGGTAQLLGVVGDDAAGQELRDALEAAGIAAGNLLAAPGRSTSLKTRIVAHHQQVCRTDRESREPLDREARRRLAEMFDQALEVCDVVILSDYGKGVLTDGNASSFIQAARAKGVRVVVDPKSSDFSLYHQATVITPNMREAITAAGPGIDSSDLEQIAMTLLDRSRAEYVLVTRGEDGMFLAGRSEKPCEIHAMAREVYDVTGAGDTVVATLALGLAAGSSMRQAALVANCAAGVVVEKLGTAAVTVEEILERLTDESPN